MKEPSMSQFFLRPAELVVIDIPKSRQSTISVLVTNPETDEAEVIEVRGAVKRMPPPQAILDLRDKSAT
jgi:hypothetical protein